MIRKPLLLLAALSLGGCAAIPALMGLPVAPPAPLAHIAIDEQALNIGYEAYDAILTAVDGLVASGRLVRGSPKALQVQHYLIVIRDTLNAATAAAHAGNATDYGTAVRSVTAAFTSVRTLLGAAS